VVKIYSRNCGDKKHDARETEIEMDGKESMGTIEECTERNYQFKDQTKDLTKEKNPVELHLPKFDRFKSRR
jgi:hypothetical protein